MISQKIAIGEPLVGNILHQSPLGLSRSVEIGSQMGERQMWRIGKHYALQTSIMCLKETGEEQRWKWEYWDWGKAWFSLGPCWFWISFTESHYRENFIHHFEINFLNFFCESVKERYLVLVFFRDIIMICKQMFSSLCGGE